MLSLRYQVHGIRGGGGGERNEGVGEGLYLLSLLLLLGRGQVPGLDDVLLRAVDVLLRLDVLDADADALLGEDDVLLPHLLARLFLYLHERHVDLPANKGKPGEEDDEDAKGEELAVYLLGWFGTYRLGQLHADVTA